MSDPLDSLHKLGAKSMSIGEAYRIDLNDEWTGSLDDLALLERIPVCQIVLHDYVFEDAHLDRLCGLTLPHLKRLWLNDTGATDAGLRPVSKMDSIRGLVLSTGSFTDNGMRYVSEMHQLEELNISEQPVSDAGLELISKLACLKELGVSQTLVEGTTIPCFAESQHLSKLWLCGTFVGSKGTAALSKIPNLRQLSLDNTHVNDCDLQPLEKTGLEYLSLGGNNVTDDAATIISTMTCIGGLCLWRTRVTNAGMLTLAELAKLYYLQLWCTAVTRHGAEAIAKSNPECDIQFHKPDAAY